MKLANFVFSVSKREIFVGISCSYTPGPDFKVTLEMQTCHTDADDIIYILLEAKVL